MTLEFNIKSLHRMKLRVLIAGLVLVIVSGTGYYLFQILKPVEQVVETALVNYGSSVLDVEVKVGSVNIDFDRATASIENLFIANPAGFDTEYAINTNEVTLELDIESLLEDRLILRDITIMAPDLIYEYGKSGTNLDKLAENAVAYLSKEPGKLELAASSSLLVDNIHIINPRLQISHRLLKGKTLKLNLPDIRLHNPADTYRNSSPAEIAQDILSSIKTGTGMAAASLSMGKSFQNNEHEQILSLEQIEMSEENTDWIFQ